MDRTYLYVADFQALDSDDLVPLSTDLRESISTLSDVCIQAYQQLVSITQERLHRLISTFSRTLGALLPPAPLMSSHSSSSSSVPSLLEGESIAGPPGSGVVKLGGSRRRAGSDPRTVGGDVPTMAPVLRELGALHAALSRQALPAPLVEQTFQQLVYYMSASAFNSLLLRKDICCCSRGMQIR